MAYFNFFRRCENEIFAKDVLGEFENYQKANSEKFIHWITDNRCHSEQVLKRDVPQGGFTITNSAGITEAIKIVSDEFSKMYRRRAYLHYYRDEGMDEMEFSEAESDLNNLVGEYSQY